MKLVLVVTRWIVPSIGLLLAVSSLRLSAQEKDEAEIAKWKRALIEVAADYRIVVDGDKDALVFQKEPLMVWVNPVRESQYGVIHVWTSQGRPRVFGSVFVTKDEKTKTRRITHELHSLAPAGLTANHPPQGVVWKPTIAGIEQREMNGAPEPVQSRTGRLVQMRQLAREFTAHSIDLGGNRLELRLLPQPLYRFDVGDDIHDGAIFSMISNSGTDPEILLIFEVRDTKEGPRWHYAVARFSDLTQYLDLRGERVWELTFPKGVQQWSWRTSETDTYRLFVDRNIPEEDVESFLRQGPMKQIKRSSLVFVKMYLRLLDLDPS